jgi:hypothetical protein
MGLGVLVLGVGGRVAMRLVAEATTGAGGFSLGGTLTVVFLGLVSGAAGGLILLAARTLLRRWPPAPSLAFWFDNLRLILVLPLVAVFGGLLQWRTWRYRRPVS